MTGTKKLLKDYYDRLRTAREAEAPRAAAAALARLKGEMAAQSSEAVPAPRRRSIYSDPPKIVSVWGGEQVSSKPAEPVMPNSSKPVPRGENNVESDDEDSAH